MDQSLQDMDARALGRADGLWTALAEAPARWVSVRDTDGRLLYINRPALARVGRPGSSLVRSPLGAIMPAETADEHSRMLGDVAATGRPLCLLGAERGVLVRTLYRRIEADGAAGNGSSLVLITAGPVLEQDGVLPGAPAGDGAGDPIRTVRAECNDWGPLVPLSLREVEVMRMVGQGQSSPEIAARLERSVKTIENHRLSIAGKLVVKGRVDLVRMALLSGLAIVSDEEFSHFAERWPRRPARRAGARAE